MDTKITIRLDTEKRKKIARLAKRQQMTVDRLISELIDKEIKFAEGNINDINKEKIHLGDLLSNVLLKEGYKQPNIKDYTLSSIQVITAEHFLDIFYDKNTLQS